MPITLENLTQVYRSPSGEPRPVLDIPAWHIGSGQHVLLRGVSGSGKTSLFNIMTGLLKPTGGRVLYDDLPLYSLPEAARDRFRAVNIGYIFQSHFLLSTLTAVQNVEMPMAFARGIPAAERRKRSRELLDRLGLADHFNDYPQQLSTGQRMRVAVARALANRPHAVFADEPTAALDADSAVQVMDLIRETCTASGAILLVASHDPALASYFSHYADLKAGHLTLSERHEEHAEVQPV